MISSMIIIIIIMRELDLVADGGGQDNGVVLEIETRAMADEPDISSLRFNLVLSSTYWEGGQVELNTRFMMKSIQFIIFHSSTLLFLLRCFQA